jgi:hypothetical protein
VDVDGLVGAAVGLLPDLGEQHPLADDLARVLGEVHQQVELLAGQLERAAVETGLSGAFVDGKTPDDDWLDSLPGGHPAQDRPDSCLEVLGGERLDNVIVGAGVQDPDDLRLVVAGGRHDDRHPAHRADHLDQRAAVEVGQPEVENHQVGRGVDHRLQTGHCCRCGRDSVAALGERARQCGADRRVVLDQQKPGHGLDRTQFQAKVRHGHLIFGESRIDWALRVGKCGYG